MDSNWQCECGFEQFKRYLSFWLVDASYFCPHSFEWSTRDFYDVIFVQVFDYRLSHDVAFDFGEAYQAWNSGTYVPHTSDCFFNYVGTLCFDENVTLEGVWNKDGFYRDLGHLNLG